jgi:hypothetical protein
MQTFRKATFADMDLIFKWANDPENMANLVEIRIYFSCCRRYAA